MNTKYDAKIAEHYNQVAADCGLSPHSTMADDIIRGRETAAIVDFVALAVQERGKGATTVVDVGCGNGYTLKRLASEVPGCAYLGIEYNDRLRDLAKQQVSGMRNVTVLSGDLRLRQSLDMADGSVDLLICQRVLINLLSPQDAKLALDNIVSLVRVGGRLLFIESFDAALATLNEARAEFGLAAIPPAHHNRYLPEDFFVHPKLEPLASRTPRNALSTHYYVTRVLHSALTESLNAGFKRNSHFVRFFSTALPEAVGDFAPLQFRSFRRKA